MVSIKSKVVLLSTIVSIVTKQSVGGILTERDSQISLQASNIGVEGGDIHSDQNSVGW
jgi:hypothetical protein